MSAIERFEKSIGIGIAIRVISRVMRYQRSNECNLAKYILLSFLFPFFWSFRCLVQLSSINMKHRSLIYINYSSRIDFCEIQRQNFIIACNLSVIFSTEFDISVCSIWFIILSRQEVCRNEQGHL